MPVVLLQLPAGRALREDEAALRGSFDRASRRSLTICFAEERVGGAIGEARLVMHSVDADVHQFELPATEQEVREGC